MSLDRDRVRRLVAFYSVFDGHDAERRPFAEQIPLPPKEPGGRTDVHPDRYDYPPALQHYREVLYDDGWLDGPYDQREGFEYMDHPGLIAEADAETVARVLRFIKAMDYWTGGSSYKDAVENGLLPGALRRLAEIANVELPGHPDR